MCLTQSRTSRGVSLGKCVTFSRKVNECKTLVRGRGLHSSTTRLNVSTFCGMRWVHDCPPVY